MLNCDLHVHTNFSKDGESSVEEILERADEIGLDVIAITDHDTVEGAKKALLFMTRVLVIPGIEVSTKQGHLIVLGVTEVIPAGLELEVLRQAATVEAKDQEAARRILAGASLLETMRALGRA